MRQRLNGDKCDKHYTGDPGTYVTSVAEPPLFWAAPVVRGPGALSGSTKLGRLRLQAKKGGSWRLRLHTLKFFILSS